MGSDEDEEASNITFRGPFSEFAFLFNVLSCGSVKGHSTRWRLSRPVHMYAS